MQNTNKKLTGLSFSEIWDYLKAGYKVKRYGWKNLYWILKNNTVMEHKNIYEERDLKEVIPYVLKNIEFNDWVVIPKKQGLSFAKAFETIKCGTKGMRLPSWKEDVVIRCQRPDAHSKMTHPYLYIESRFGCVPWKETVVELFSNDWIIVD